MEPVVQIKNVSKNIGNKQIIKDISFDIYPGEVFGFLGPNGAGKTTTIRMLLGLAKITQGEIFINGYSIKNDFEKAIAGVGGIVESPELYKYLSGLKNLKVFARMHEHVTKERIDEVVKLVGMEKAINNKVKTYSLGMRQRLGVAQAILHRPKLLVLDEPTNGLDPAGIKEFRDYIRHLAKSEKTAVLVSSHLLSEMELMCDRIAIIQEGKILSVQKVDQAITQEESKKVSITATPIKDAEKILRSLNLSEIEIVENTIELQTNYEKLPEITRKLVESGINVYEIKLVNKTLEDKFMEITGGQYSV